MVKKSSG
jgi:hypothetical protein